MLFLLNSWDEGTWSNAFQPRSQAWRDMAARWRDHGERVHVWMPAQVPVIQQELAGMRARCSATSCTLHAANGRTATARKGLRLDAALGNGKGLGADGFYFAVVESVRAPDYVTLGLIVRRPDGNWIEARVRLEDPRERERKEARQRAKQ